MFSPSSHRLVQDHEYRLCSAVGSKSQLNVEFAMDSRQEARKLRKVDDNLLQVDHRITRQKQILRELAEHHCDTALARRLLRALIESRRAMADRRTLLIEHIQRLNEMP